MNPPSDVGFQPQFSASLSLGCCPVLNNNFFYKSCSAAPAKGKGGEANGDREMGKGRRGKEEVKGPP